MKNLAEVFKRSWYGYDNGAGGTGAKVCNGKTPGTKPYVFCRANSYSPEHSPGCDVVAAAEELRAAGYEVDVSLR